jgi:hypothetical protein
VEGSIVTRKSRTHFPQVPLEIAILKKQADGSTHWVEAAMNIDSAKERVQALAECFPGVYVIVDRKTGREINVRATDADVVPGISGTAIN